MKDQLTARFQHNDIAYHMWYDRQETICNEDEEEFDCDTVFARTVLGQSFIDWMNDNLETKIKFESMYFPREYNFEEDQINVSFSMDDVKKLLSWSEEYKEILNDIIEEFSTSRSGYIAFYSKEEFNSNPELLMTALLQAYSNVESEDFEDYFDRKCIYDHMYKEA